jgi:hypothetical protein
MTNSHFSTMAELLKEVAAEQVAYDNYQNQLAEAKEQEVNARNYAALVSKDYSTLKVSIIERFKSPENSPEDIENDMKKLLTLASQVAQSQSHYIEARKRYCNLAKQGPGPDRLKANELQRVESIMFKELGAPCVSQGWAC